MDIQAGRVEVTENDVLPDFADPVAVVLDAFINAGLGEQAGKRTLAFFTSDVMLDIPFNRLSAMLLASLSGELQRGRKQPVDLGTPADFAAISTTLPYCDAVLVDNKCSEYLGQEPLAGEVARHGCRIFSLRSKERMLAYLDEVEASRQRAAQAAHHAALRPIPTAPALTFDEDESSSDSSESSTGV